VVYLPSRDCTYGRQRQHSPSYARHHVIAELRDQLMLQQLRNKRIGHRREQKSHVVTMELRGDKESE
jgi:hypothetical protein